MPFNTKVYTLIFLKGNNKLLLGYKTRGLGAKYWNGFGGKLEEGESLHECAKRELKEESNLEAELKHVGVIICDRQVDHREVIHVFTSVRFWGEIIESEEMNPIKWYPYDNIPFDNMWPNVKIWYPIMLKEQYFSVTITQNKEKFIQKVDTFKSFKEFFNFLKCNECN